jgi:hypothetical protein
MTEVKADAGDRIKVLQELVKLPPLNPKPSRLSKYKTIQSDQTHFGSEIVLPADRKPQPRETVITEELRIARSKSTNKSREILAFLPPQITPTKARILANIKSQSSLHPALRQR